MRRVYLDHNATSPATGDHLSDLLHAVARAPGNPSSPHAAGRDASVAITTARRHVAAATGFDVSEVVFLSGGSEGNNACTAGVLALPANAAGALGRPPHAITSAIEHPSVLEPLRRLEAAGAVELTVLPVDSEGRFPASAARDALRPATRLVTFMAANNETGVRLPVKEFGDWLHVARWGKETAAGIPQGVDRDALRALHFHVDGVQAFGKLRPAEWVSPGADSVTVCAHKLGGLSGVGAVALRRGRKFVPAVVGGAQEKNRRAGTENLLGVMSLGLVAKAVCEEAWWSRIEAMDALRLSLRAGLEGLPGLRWNTPVEGVLPNTLNFSLGVPVGASEWGATKRRLALRGEDVLMELDMRGICASSGSACSSGTNLPSKVLIALGRTDAEARDAVRLSLGPSTSKSDIEDALAALRRVLGGG